MLSKLTARHTAIVAMALVAIAVCGPGVARAADGEMPDYSREGADTCFQCHDDSAMLALTSSVTFLLCRPFPFFLFPRYFDHL